MLARLPAADPEALREAAVLLRSLAALAEPWRPDRTAACLLLWSSLDNAPE